MTTQNVQRETLTTEEVATILGISVPVVRKQLRQKRLIGVRVGKEWRVARVELDRYMKIGAPTNG